MSKTKDETIFCADYWKAAAKPFTELQTLCLAAVFIALRVAVDAISIPLGPDLYISVSFLVTALGSFLYGPLMGLACGAVTDTISALLFPKGAYFFPFIFVEMLGGFLFGLFLWRRNPTPTRLILSRLSVTVICNLIMNSAALLAMYAWLGNPKTSLAFMIPRLIKNVVLFPAECLLLMILFEAVIPQLSRLHLGVNAQPVSGQLRWQHYLLMGGLIPVAVLMVFLYYNCFR